MKEDDKEVFIMFTLIILCNFGGCVPLMGQIFRVVNGVCFAMGAFLLHYTFESQGFRAGEKYHSVTAGL